ncbi:MAG: hypothetical protein AVDCRST_MAG48-3828, partial [uncultured Friedmanniella sp.]
GRHHSRGAPGCHSRRPARHGRQHLGPQHHGSQHPSPHHHGRLGHAHPGAGSPRPPQRPGDRAAGSSRASARRGHSGAPAAGLLRRCPGRPGRPGRRLATHRAGDRPGAGGRSAGRHRRPHRRGPHRPARHRRALRRRRSDRPRPAL